MVDMNYFELIFLKPAKFYARRWGKDWQDVYHDLILAYYVLKERGKITDKDRGGRSYVSVSIIS